MVKKILTGALGLGMVLSTVAPAFAARVSVFNTGQGSIVDARVDRVKTLLLDLTNDYDLNHSVTANQTTGGNEADNNTGSGLSAAGNVTGNHTSQVEANTTNVDIDASDNETCNCVDEVTVNTTGQDSTVNAVVDSSKTVNVTVSNSGSVNNTFTSIVNTGGNTANNNTGNGTALGGDVSIMSMITTKLNSVWLKIKL